MKLGGSRRVQRAEEKALRLRIGTDSGRDNDRDLSRQGNLHLANDEIVHDIVAFGGADGVENRSGVAGAMANQTDTINAQKRSPTKFAVVIP